MKILALETDNEKAKKEILLSDEEEILSVRYHGLWFVARLMSPIVFLLIIGIAYAIPSFIFGIAFGFNWIAILSLLVVCVFVTFFPSLKAWIDWKYDGIILTDKRLIILNQTSIFKEDNRKMDLENVASVRAITQYWNVFPFGKLHIDLKEGVGRSIELPFVPNAARVARCISECVCKVQKATSVPTQA